MKIEFYYWDMQCPINNEMLRLLEKYSEYFEITLYNVKDDFEIAKKQRLFFPTLTVVDDVNRYFSPISDKFFDSLLNNQYPKEKPSIIKHGKEKYTGKVIPLTEKNEGLKMPQAVATATAEYRSEMDIIGAFLGACCTDNPN